MSSIYRKGRDGYFYYQSYVLNPKTGKKDKRIFYSLGTKDKNIALSKKNILDKKYENKKHNEYKAKKWKYYLFIFFFGINSVFYFSKNQQKQITDKSINKKMQADLKKPSDVDDFSESNIAPSTLKIDTTAIKKPIVDQGVSEFSSLLPNSDQYKIHRIINISDAFGQCKILVTISDNVNVGSLKKLSRHIMQTNTQFSNFIICYYSNDKIGNLIANGEIDELYTEIELQNAFKAMFTYNDVEGEYFDDNPVGYLNAY